MGIDQPGAMAQGFFGQGMINGLAGLGRCKLEVLSLYRGEQT